VCVFTVHDCSIQTHLFAINRFHCSEQLLYMLHKIGFNTMENYKALKNILLKVIICLWICLYSILLNYVMSVLVRERERLMACLTLLFIVILTTVSKVIPVEHNWK